MVQLLPGDTRSDDAIKTLKIKRERLNSLNAIDEVAVPEVISILNGYNAKAKNVQVVANNIRTAKTPPQKPLQSLLRAKTATVQRIRRTSSWHRMPFK